MKTLAEFTRTTLIGGLLIILPVYIAIILLAKTLKGLLGLLQPVAARNWAAKCIRLRPAAAARSASTIFLRK